MEAAARLHGIGGGLDAKSPEKAARKFLRRLPLPVGWTEPEWDLLGLVVRYHRGKEPKAKQKGFARLTKEERGALCAMAGVWRPGGGRWRKGGAGRGGVGGETRREGGCCAG